MAHSFVMFRDKQYHARDATIDAVVLVVIGEYHRQNLKNAKIETMFADWLEQRHWAFGIGCIDLHLDLWLDDDEEMRKTLAQLLHRAKEWYQQFGEDVPAEAMNDLIDRYGSPEDWGGRGGGRYFAASPIAFPLRLIDEWLKVLGEPSVDAG